MSSVLRPVGLEDRYLRRLMEWMTYGLDKETGDMVTLSLLHETVADDLVRTSVVVRGFAKAFLEQPTFLMTVDWNPKSDHIPTATIEHYLDLAIDRMKPFDPTTPK
jgi:hypothetical protein